MVSMLLTCPIASLSSIKNLDLTKEFDDMSLNLSTEIESGEFITIQWEIMPRQISTSNKEEFYDTFGGIVFYSKKYSLYIAFVETGIMSGESVEIATKRIEIICQKISVLLEIPEKDKVLNSQTWHNKEENTISCLLIKREMEN